MKALRRHACPTSMEANLSNNPNDSTEHEPHVHARFQSHCVRGYVYCTGCQDFQTAGVVVRFGVVRRLLHPPRYIVLPPCPPQPGLLRGNNRPTQIDSTFNPSCIIHHSSIGSNVYSGHQGKIRAQFSPSSRHADVAVFRCGKISGVPQLNVELLRNPQGPYRYLPCSQQALPLFSLVTLYSN